MFIIYVAIFGVIWGLGTSLLAGALPPDPLTRVVIIGWFEVMMMLLTKIVVRHPLSVTFAVTLAATISIFTFSFGPPNPYKPLFIAAGFAFDAGTFFRTTKLRAWNLILGSVLYIVTAGFVFVGIFYLIEPAAMKTVAAAFPFAAVIFVGFAIVMAFIFDRLFLVSPPARIREVWRQIGREK
jgi:hypothetical protein